MSSRPWTHSMRGVWAALGVYGLVAFLLFGLPVAGTLNTSLVAGGDIEPSAYHWWLAWWPDALIDGRNPFISDFIYAPDRVNLTWVTSIPGPALVLTPVTRAIGPVASYNLLSLAAPVLAATSAFLLCRHLTRRFWPSLAGGYVFGFSPFMLVALAGIPSVGFVAFIPLAVYVVVRRIDESLGRRASIALLALVLAGQFLVSVEAFAVMTVLGGLIGLIAYALVPDLRHALRRVVPDVVLGYLGAVLIVSPFLWYMLFEPHLRPLHAIPERNSVDLLSFAVPTSLQALGAGTFPSLERDFGGALPVAGGAGGFAYLGLPLLAIAVLFGLERPREPRRKLILVAAASLAILSLGPRLIVAGEDLIPLPGALLAEVPLLQYALPSRFPVYTALAVAVLLAVWLAARPARWKWAVVVAALAFIAPNLESGFWKVTTGVPPFFHEKQYEGVLFEEDIVFTVPVMGAPVRWQAEAEMPFRLANGYIGRVPDDLTRFYRVIAADGPLPQQETRRFLERRRVTAILIAAPSTEYPRWRRRLAFLGAAPRELGGVLVYRLAPPGRTPSLG
jgi:hypothetical protein